MSFDFGSGLAMDERRFRELSKIMRSVPLHVGHVANNWAKLEHAMVPLLRMLLKTSDYAVAKIILFSSNPPQRRDLLLALTEIGPFPAWLTTEIESFCKEYERLRLLRNNIVHGHWDRISTAGVPMVRAVKSREKLKEQLEPYEIAEIKQIARDLDALAKRAGVIEQHLQLGTSP
jgi:hypothetical protein